MSNTRDNEKWSDQPNNSTVNEKKISEISEQKMWWNLYCK